MLKTAWGWLDGKKTVIGAILSVLLFGLLEAGFIDQATFDQITWVSTGILGIGLVHKAVRNM